MGLQSPYAGPSDVMDEQARVTPIWKGVNYDRLQGSGRCSTRSHVTHPGTTFLFADGFPTATGEEIRGVEYLPPRTAERRVSLRAQHRPPDVSLAYRHTMKPPVTRAGQPRAGADREMHVEDAAELGLRDGHADLTTRRGRCASTCCFRPPGEGTGVHAHCTHFRRRQPTCVTIPSSIRTHASPPSR
jgi:formate dehydrogenase major subunit